MLVTLDFETYFDTKFSLNKMTTMEYVQDERFKVWGVGIKIEHGPAQWYTEDEVEDALREIPWESVMLICHNTPFDAFILTQYYKLVPNYYVDTAAMSRGLYPGQSARLRDCAIRLFPNDESKRKGEELVNAKGIVDLPPDLDEEIGKYCIQDVELTYLIWKQMLCDMPHSEMDLINLTCKMFCEPTLHIDRERLTEYHKNEYEKAENLIENSGIDRKILSSNQQFSKYIEDVLLITPPTKKSPTTGEQIPALGKNDAAFKQMQKMHPELQHVWDARIAVKSRLTETRAKRFLDSALPDNSLPVPLRYYAAHTGRFGGTEKLNMQNLPRGGELRRCISAAPGSLLYVADLSNIEARMLAWLAGESSLLYEFSNGEDVYSKFASIVYGRPIDKTNDPIERFVGKMCILGLGYGMGGQKFKDALGSGAAGPAVHFTLEESSSIVRTYRQTYPSIPMLWGRLETLLKQTLHKQNFGNVYGPLIVGDSSIILPNKMALRYHNLRYASQGLIYESRNKIEYTYGGRITENVIQALSRIVITDSMLRLSKSFDVALQVHDEIIISSTGDNPSDTMSKMITDMCISPEWATDLPLDAEGTYGAYYAK